MSLCVLFSTNPSFLIVNLCLLACLELTVNGFVIDQNCGVWSRSSWSESSLYMECVGLRYLAGLI